MKRPAWLKLPQRAASAERQPAAGGRVARIFQEIAGRFAGLGQKRLVALDFDGFTLRAAIVEARRGEPRIVAHAESRLLPLTAALAEALAALRGRAGRLPRAAVLATAQMLAAEIPLPVAPAKPRKRAQMLELARWELEPLASQTAMQWNLGAILTGLGYLTTGQRLDVAEDQRRAGGPPLRFGERARELGFIGDEQLARALAAQKLLQGASAELDCDCAPMAGEARDGAWPWLGVAIDRGARGEWFEACRAEGLRLAHLYPRAGLTALALPPAGDAVGIEIRSDAFVSWSRQAGRLASLAQDARSEAASGAAEVLGLLPVQPANLPDQTDFFYHLDSNEAGLAPGLAHAWGGRARLVSPGGLESPWAPLYGLAAHALGLRAAAVCARLKGREQPPLYRHPDFVRYAVPALALVGVIAGEAELQWRLSRGEKRLADIEAAFKQEGTQQTQIQSALAEGERLRKEVDGLRTRAVDLANRAELLDEKLLGRLERVPTLLRALAAAMSDEVVLEAVREAGRQEGFNVVAWGRRDAPLLEFARNAQEHLGQVDLGVINTEFAAAEGRTGAPGYRVSFWVVRDPDALLQSAVAPAPKPAPGSAKP